MNKEILKLSPYQKLSLHANKSFKLKEAIKEFIEILEINDPFIYCLNQTLEKLDEK